MDRTERFYGAVISPRKGLAMPLPCGRCLKSLLKVGSVHLKLITERGTMWGAPIFSALRSR